MKKDLKLSKEDRKHIIEGLTKVLKYLEAYNHNKYYNICLILSVIYKDSLTLKWFKTQLPTLTVNKEFYNAFSTYNIIDNEFFVGEEYYTKEEITHISWWNDWSTRISIRINFVNHLLNKLNNER